MPLIVTRGRSASVNSLDALFGRCNDPDEVCDADEDDPYHHDPLQAVGSVTFTFSPYLE